MKKVLAILLVSLMVISLFAGCGKKEVDITPSAPPAEPAKPAETTQPAANTPAVPSEPTAPAEPEKPKPEGEGVMNIAATGDVATLNPQTYSMARDSDAIDRLSMTLYETVIGEDGNFKYQPEFAADFPKQMDDTRTVWQIPIRKGLKWDNGDEMTAEDALYTYKMLLDPVLLNSRASAFANNYIVVKNATEYNAGKCDWEDVGWKMVDDYTIELTVDNAVTDDEILSHFNNAALALVNKTVYEASLNTDRTTCMYGTSKDTIVSCGPYTLKDWIEGASISYQKNPDYVFADNIWINTINERTISDASTRLQLFLNGELDYVSLGDEEYLQYKEDPRVIESNATSMRHISVNMCNTEKAILTSTNFRLALYYGSNRAEMASMCNGYACWWYQPLMVIGNLETGECYHEMFCEAHPDWVPANDGYDPEKAKAYFEKALEETGTTKVDLTLLYNSDTAMYKSCSEYLQKTWAELFGTDRFHIDLQGMSNSQMVATKKDYKNNVNSYEMSWGAWNTSKLAPWNAYTVWRTDYGKKNEPLSLPELDDLWQRANQGEERFDKAKRLEMAYQMEKVMLDNAGVVPIIECPAHYLKADRVVLPTEDNRYVVGAGFGWNYARIVE